MILSVNAPDSGAAEEELAVAYGDEPLEIGFNAKYLLEIASQVDRENAVFLFNSSGDPTLMREGNDTSAVTLLCQCVFKLKFLIIEIKGSKRSWNIYQT